MKILGIATDVWISSAALIDDGRVVAAAPEERFNRQKMSQAFPKQAVQFCLKKAGCTWDDLDAVVVPWNPGVHLQSPSARYTDAMRWRGEYLTSVPGMIQNLMGHPPIREMEEIIHHADGKDCRLWFINHHLAHAAGAYFLSPYEKAAILTADGRGESQTCVWYHAVGNQIKELMDVHLPHSLGLFYSALTQYLGFNPHCDEWKVMSLAAYGIPNNEYYPILQSLINRFDDGRYELDLSYFDYYLFDKKPDLYNLKLVKLLGPARKLNDSIDKRHQNIAWALQQIFEETMTHMLIHLHRMTGECPLALSGGSAMNSVYNGKIHTMTPFQDIFIPSCPDDSGVSVGAALYAYYCILGGKQRFTQTHNFWGPSYRADEIAEIISKFKLRAEYHRDIFTKTAELIADGLLVGFFQDNMEFGQRALGHRSILADPRDPTVKDKLNACVKFRETFRPFAPAVLQEFAQEYFEMPDGMCVPFMEKVFPIRADKRHLIPAVVHVDGTGRLQTVSHQNHASLSQVIEVFYKITGIPLVLNTSFNINGEPIVCSPTDAVRTFYSCGLDALVLGHWLILK